MLQMRNTVHLNFNRNRDLLFNFFGRTAWPLRDDLHVIIGNVGIGLDRQVMEGDCSPKQQQNRYRQNDEAVVEGILDEKAYHSSVLTLHVRACSLFDSALQYERVDHHLLARGNSRYDFLLVIWESLPAYDFNAPECCCSSRHIDPIEVMQ